VNYAQNMSKDLGLNFEYAVRQFVGDKAHGIAGAEQNKDLFRRELRTCIPVMCKQVKNLDTTTRHKERLINDIETLDDLLKVKGGGTDGEIIVRLFWLVSRLFGFDGVSGRLYNQPFYFQYLSQFALEKEGWGGINRIDSMKKHRANVITLQKETYQFLKEKGLSDQIIAGVLNTSEHQIKKIKHDI